MTRQFVALDIEATGMKPSRDHMLEIGIVTFDRLGEQERYTTLVRPPVSIPLDIQHLTGLTNEALSDAPTFGMVADRVARLIGDRTIVGHSVQFDVNMLIGAGLALPNDQVDTFQLASVMVPDLPDYSLATVARAVGVAIDNTHRALADALTSAAVLGRLLDRLQTYDAVTLGQVAQYAQLANWPTASIFEDAVLEAEQGTLATSHPDRRGPHELAFLVPRERPETVLPRESHHVISEAEIDAAFGETGYIGGAVDRYEFRPQQEYMALRVAEAFNRGHDLIAEAGTGTGKSMAYLLPAALHAREHGETVVVSTNTLALQDQLFRKDIPRLREAMERALPSPDDEPPFRAVTVKGRSNYLCLRRWFAAAQVPVVDAVEASLRAKITLWLGETRTGDRGELRLSPTEEARWRHYSEEENACQPGRCVFHQRNQCFLFRARRDAESAHLVVVNHALLLSDSVAGSGVLPNYQRLIVDESHHLEEQATTHYGVTVGERDVTIALDATVRSEGPIQTGALMGAATFLSRPALTTDDKGRRRAVAALERVRQAMEHAQTGRDLVHALYRRIVSLADESRGRSGGDRTLRITDELREGYGWQDVLNHWTGLDTELRALEGHLRWAERAISDHEPGADTDELAATEFDTIESDIESALRDMSELAGNLREIIANPRDEQVYWLERNPQLDSATLRAAPLEVGSLLHERIFSRVETSVLTSATITTDGTFDYALEHLGLPDARQVSVPSPFDYRISAMLYLADDIPEPNQPLYQRRLNEVLIKTCAATGGRGLVLFTSYAALQATYAAIKGPLEAAGVVVLGQRTDGSPRQLIERLKHGDRIVVLGTSSLWEGIDVVGDALSLLVITKLPFSVPSDPVFAARSEAIAENGGNAFNDYAVPQAVLRFKQGFGRLIRTSQDRGVCVVLDRRILSKRYGRSFVDSLPECTVEIGSTYDLPAAAAAWMS